MVLEGKVINQNNEGLGIIKNNEKIVFVPFSLTEEIVEYEIIKENKKYDEGNLLNIKNACNERQKPKCPYYLNCGGCDLMHQKYEYQLKFKVNKVINNLKHISNIEIDNIDIESDSEFNYRNHITLSVKNNTIGFYKNHTNEIIDIDYCYISNDKINGTLKEIREFINKYKDNNIDRISIKTYNEILINIESNNFELISEFKEFVKFDSLYINNEYNSGKRYITANLDKYKYNVSSRDFFQKNTEMTVKLYSYVKSLLKKDENILDLYCGSGGIGIFVSNKAKSVIGIEVIKDAIKNAKENALMNNINNIEFICGKVEDNLENINNIDTIIVDPPRVGLKRSAINDILKINANRIIYVSCNSVTLARDLNYLKYRYKIENIKLFDLFPNTHHVESVVLLKKNNNIHSMNLNSSPFEKIKNGQKTIELRLYDEKRKKIKEGDIITFTNNSSSETLTTTVKKLHYFDSFEELYQNLPLLMCGYTNEDIKKAHPSDMEKYYSKEEQKQYGVVGIELFLHK